jgi:poly(A) polymerase
MDTPRIFEKESHHIRNDQVGSRALEVIEKLTDAGYKAYLVGGGVRDLLMHKKPKDYDISTSALPEDVKETFQRNCLLIGKRFRLAHVRFGKEIIEVATFRSGDNQEAELIVRDNVWGNEEEDVLRRDFTINGLLYDPLNHTIIDYVGGFEDLQKHCLRCIGEPVARFKQDPVRMIRMLKFRARFGFEIDPEALEALESCREEIKKSSPARILEEMFRMLESGAAEPFFKLLLEHKILDLLFPQLAAAFRGEVGEQLFKFLAAVDTLNSQGHYQKLDRSLLAAALIYPLLEKKLAEEFETPKAQEIFDLSNALIFDFLYLPFTHFPRRIRLGAHAILTLQYKLTPEDPKAAFRTRVMRQKSFSLALTFLKLRSLVDPELFQEYEKWKVLAKKNPSLQKESEERYDRRPRKRRPRRREG